MVKDGQILTQKRKANLPNVCAVYDDFITEPELA